MPCIFAEKWYLIFNDLRTVIFMGFCVLRNRAFSPFFLKHFSIFSYKNAEKNILVRLVWGTRC